MKAVLPAIGSDTVRSLAQDEESPREWSHQATATTKERTDQSFETQSIIHLQSFSDSGEEIQVSMFQEDPYHADCRIFSRTMAHQCREQQRLTFAGTMRQSRVSQLSTAIDRRGMFERPITTRWQTSVWHFIIIDDK